MPSMATGRLMGESGCIIKRIREQADVTMIVEPGGGKMGQDRIG